MPLISVSIRRVVGLAVSAGLVAAAITHSGSAVASTR